MRVGTDRTAVPVVTVAPVGWPLLAPFRAAKAVREGLGASEGKAEEDGEGIQLVSHLRERGQLRLQT